MSYRGGEPLSRCAKCRHYCSAGSTFVFSHVGLCGLVFGYTVLGAFAFEALEAGHERATKHKMQQQERVLVSALWEATAGVHVINESLWEENASAALRLYETELVQAMRKGGYDGNDDPDNLQWSFSGALLYSIIVITTIGYGNIAPKTNTGKVVTILYAIVGIPLLLLCLSNIGDAMAHSFRFVYWKVCCYLCTSPTKSRRSVARESVRRGLYADYMPADSLTRQHSFTSREAEATDAYRVPIISNKYALPPTTTDCSSTLDSYHRSPVIRQQPLPFDFSDASSMLTATSSIKGGDDDGDEQASVPIALCLSIVVGYICGGAVLFSYWEGWDYSDSCYFCFITLTTIGFGDMVPGGAVLSEDAQLALGLCSLYLLFGMALLAMSFNLVQEEVTKSVRTIGRRIGILSEEDDDDDDI